MNKNKNLLRSLKWNREHKKRRAEIRKKWSDNNRPLVNFLKRNYHYRKDGAKGTHTLQDEIDLFKRYDNKCAYCGNKQQGIDHVIPIRRGGLNTIDNLLPCCLSCNSKKKNKLLSEWKPELYAS